MAAGRYASVSSKADIENEVRELRVMPEEKLLNLAVIYDRQGLKKETAMPVAKELTDHDA